MTASVKMKTGQIIRIIFSVVAGFFIVFGICSLIFSCFYFREFRRWSEIHPLDIKVDLSRPGEFSEQFTLKCQYADFFDLLLILPNSLSEESEQGKLFSGLEGHISFLDRSGAEIDWLRKLPLEQRTKLSEGSTLLMGTVILPKDTYTFRLNVSRGAKALSGIEQRVVINYIISFAWMLPVFALYLGIFSLVFGAILALLIRLTRKKTDTHKINQTATISDEPEKVQAILHVPGINHSMFLSFNV